VAAAPPTSFLDPEGRGAQVVASSIPRLTTELLTILGPTTPTLLVRRATLELDHLRLDKSRQLRLNPFPQMRLCEGEEMDSDLYITEKPLAARWSLSAATLQRWRWLRTGPAFYRFGKTVRYRLIDIEEFEKRAVIECDGRR
jgi:hypothetical protein